MRKPYVDFLKTAFDEWRADRGGGTRTDAEPAADRAPLLNEPTHIMAKAGRYHDGFLLRHHGQDLGLGFGLGHDGADRRRLVRRASPWPMRCAGRRAIMPMPTGPAASAISTTRRSRRNILRTAHERVAILDIDVHHGNGTQAIFYDRPDVLTVSIHADPAEYLSVLLGFCGRRWARADGEGSNLNMPLPVGSGDDVWLARSNMALERIARICAAARW